DAMFAFFFQAEDGIRDFHVTGVQTCALPISLAVPMQAVFREGPVAFVYTPRGGRFERTPIRTGRRSSSYIEVAAGLKEGAMVLRSEERRVGKGGSIRGRPDHRVDARTLKHR